MYALSSAFRVLCAALALSASSVAMAQQATPHTLGANPHFDVSSAYRDPNATSPPYSRSGATSSCDSQDDSTLSLCQSFWDNPCPCGYIQVDALFLRRESQVVSQAIIVDPNTLTTFLSTTNLGFNFDPGVRVTAGMQWCQGRMVEFSYFGLFGGNASATVISPDPAAFLIFPNNLVGNVFVDFDRAFLDYASGIHSLEANCLCCCGCCETCGCQECSCGSTCNKSCWDALHCRSFTWFAGFRYLNLNEQFDIVVQRDILGGVEEGSYRLRTNNNLYGAQLGARVRRTNGRFGWEGTAKAGIFGNDARQEQTVTDFPNFPLRPTVSSSTGRVAFLGEINLTALYRLSDMWNLRAGYTAFFIEGVALAPDQLDFNFGVVPSGDQINSGGGVFLHGFNVGLEARW